MDQAFRWQCLCKSFACLETIAHLAQPETNTLQAGMFKHNGGGHQGFIGDFRALDLPGCRAARTGGCWISAADIVLPAGLPETGWTAENQYKLRFRAEPARWRGYPASGL